jgi:hypothetical protein
MHKITTLLILAILTWSCDNRKDPYYTLDDNPVLTVQKLTDTISRTSLTDSMILGMPYVFKYNIVSAENLVPTVQKSTPTDSVSIRDNRVYVTSRVAGISNYLLKTVDSFGKTASAAVQITFVTKLPPVCEFTVTTAPRVSPYEIDINASASRDPEAQWGGKIVQYNFVVQNSYNIQTPLSEIHYVCEGPGQKTISVRVQDNTGTWSDFKTVLYMLTTSNDSIQHGS